MDPSVPADLPTMHGALNEVSVNSWSANAKFWDDFMGSEGNDFYQILENACSGRTRGSARRPVYLGSCYRQWLGSSENGSAGGVLLLPLTRASRCSSVLQTGQAQKRLHEFRIPC